MSSVLAMILAGGEGTRLMPLTNSRSKPAVPFGGSYRLIDFVLNNFVNSGIFRIYVITQYKSQSLQMHLKKGWSVSGISGAFIDALPAQMRVSREWYQGTADAIYQNEGFIKDAFAENVCIFGSDHIYKMDVRAMINYHTINDADLTIAAIKMPVEACSKKFGIIEVDEKGRMIGFEEKPEQPKPIPGDDKNCLVSMGNYIFKSDILCKELKEDAQNNNSSHDFGKDIIPKMVERNRVFAYDVSGLYIEGEIKDCYWRDVGSIDSFYEAHMDLLGSNPKFRLNNPKWPMHTYYPPLAPANFTNTPNNDSEVSRSLISGGCNIDGATIKDSVLGFCCNANDGATVEGCVLIGDNIVGEDAKIKNAILDRKVEIAPGFALGYDREADAKLLKMDHNPPVRISENGIIVIPKGMKLGFDK
ncbi:MAG: glucose-1-phosphate adenylyltransferase [Succinivibrio sp.]|jgi:glucose-1-phosphate adenylyltransferase|nr:glucose-1-phosphate adenylyltransferase [Succinivibrio sp.]